MFRIAVKLKQRKKSQGRKTRGRENENRRREKRVRKIGRKSKRYALSLILSENYSRER